MQFKGAPVFYSWPSKGSFPFYIVDEQTIEWAQTDLKIFLSDFFEQSNAQNIYLIAHSMGNRALTRAIGSLLNEKPFLRKRLKEIILQAPDIDADVFKRDIAPMLTATGNPITLYASSKDIALLVSKVWHGGVPRAGDAGQQLVILPGIETIDATEIDEGFLGHSYYANDSLISDMFYLISDGFRANKRHKLISVNTKAGQYWKFRK